MLWFTVWGHTKKLKRNEEESTRENFQKRPSLLDTDQAISQSNNHIAWKLASHSLK